VRPDWDTYFLHIANAVAIRADCSRRKVGAVVIDREHRVVSTGYNGAYPGGPSCLNGECPRGRHYLPYDSPGYCMCGEEWPCIEAVPAGSSYDTGPGACVAVHAELNAILFADRERLRGATLYITDKPCDACAKHIRSTPIHRVVWPEGEYINER
jgi:dCMP deaminase